MLYLPRLYLPHVTLLDAVGSHTYQCCMMLVIQAVWPSASYTTEWAVGKCSGQLEWKRGLLKVEGRGIKQVLIPYVRQMELANVPIEGWIIDPVIHGLLDGLCNVMHLPTHYGKGIHPGMMTCGVGMVQMGERVLKCSLHLSPKVLADSTKYSSSHSNLSHLNFKLY